MQLLKTCSDRGVAHKYFYDPPGRSWSSGRAHAVLDLVEQALVRPAAAGPCHGQLHPALGAIGNGGTGATLGVARRARFGRRPFAFDGRLMQASSTGSLPITPYGSCRPRSAAAD